MLIIHTTKINHFISTTKDYTVYYLSEAGLRIRGFDQIFK